MYDVFCVGITCCDLIFAGLEDMPKLGKESACRDFLIKPGGAANTPVALAKLKIKTLFASVIGNDYLGKETYRYLEKTGLDMVAILRGDEYRTNTTAVLSVGNERAFASYFARYNHDIIIELLKRYVPQSRHVHAYINECLNMPVLDIVKKYNRSLSVDMSWDERIKLDDIKHILANCNIFFANEIEACSITGKKNAEEALDEIAQYAPIVAVKMGSNGSLVRAKGKKIKIPIVDGINVKDTTGAGDLYAAGFIYGYLKGWDIEKTALFASASGMLAVTFYGGMDETYTIKNIMHCFENNYYK